MAFSAPIRGVILDMDGTLIDSMQIWHEIDIAFFAENGLELPEGLSEQVAKMSIGEWSQFFVEHFVPSMQPGEVVARVEEMAAEYYRAKIPLKPHVPAFLDTLDALGLPYGICTATYRSSADAVLTRLHLKERMQFVLTGEDYTNGKGEMYLAAARLLGAPPPEILVVEDALHCIEIAKTLGFPTAAVYDPSVRPEDWERAVSLADVSGTDLSQICIRPKNLPL